MKAEIEELPTGETCIGKTVLKLIDEGLFKGTVMIATKRRGRVLYHVVYEDGDSEDVNDKELMEAYEMFKTRRDTTLQTSVLSDVQEHSENDTKISRGEAESSEYELSDEDNERNRSKQKQRTRHNKKLKEKDTNDRDKKNKKEDDTPHNEKRNMKRTVIDVEALLKSGDKNSVISKTIAAMTPEQQTEILGSVEKTLIQQDKKGLQVQAMKVCDYGHSLTMIVQCLDIQFLTSHIFFAQTKYTMLVVEAQLKRLQSMRISVSDMVHTKTEIEPEITSILTAAGGLTVGDWVEVMHDFSPGNNSGEDLGVYH